MRRFTFLLFFINRGDGIFIQTDIINIGVGSVFRLDRLDSMGILKNRHFLSGIEKVSEYPRSGSTRFHAGRFESSIDSVRTEGTFLNNLLDRMDIPDRIRTSHHTIPASNTGVGVDRYNPIFPLKRGIGGTNGDATRVIAVIAENGQKRPSHIGIPSLFDLFHPGWPYTKGNLVLHLAGHFTGMAADAASKVYDHAIFDLFHLFSQTLVPDLIPFYFKV